MANEKNIPLRASKAPNLPIGPVEYSHKYQDEINNALRQYFAQVDNFTQASVIPDSGVTADRPLDTGNPQLQIGQYYFDTTLGIPIWWDGTNWVDATGTTV
jgi:hypothetical protein